MTVVDWMMIHPWMTFFIALSFSAAVVKVVAIIGLVILNRD